MKAQNIEDLSDAREWAIEHDAIIRAWWAEQHKWNAMMESKSTNLRGRVSTLEKRMIYLAGFASAIGAFSTAIGIAVGLSKLYGL